MIVDGKKITIKSVPTKVKNLSSRIASIAKSATRKMSNWYAAHISDKKFDRMDTKKQEKILEHIKDYNETTLDKKAESKAEQILNSSENHYANVDEYMANTNRIENFRDDLDINKSDENKIKELEAKIDELTKRNEEILEQEKQEKNDIKNKIISENEARYNELKEKYENKKHEYEIDIDHDSDEKAEEADYSSLIDTLSKRAVEAAKKESAIENFKIEEPEEKNEERLSDIAQIEKNLGIRITSRNDEVIKKIGNVFSKNLSEAFSSLAASVRESFDATVEAVINNERKKRDELLKVASDKISSLAKENGELKNSLNAVNTDLENSKYENKLLDQKNIKLNQENELLAKQNKELSDEKSYAYSALVKSKEENSKMQNKIRSLDSNLTEMKDVHKREIEEIEDKYSDQIAKMKEAYEKRIKQLEDKISDSAKILNDVNIGKVSEKETEEIEKTVEEKNSTNKDKIERLNSAKKVITDLNAYTQAPSFDYTSFDLGNVFDEEEETKGKQK